MACHSLLIVDDEPDIRQLLRIFFERQGFTVTLASDGQAAVEQAARIRPDAILMDIQMPRKTGIEAIRELRTDTRFAHIPMIALTAYAQAHKSIDILQAGFDRVIYKPVDLGALHYMIEDDLR